ncbi:MAG: helix-turn-helix transcriptional regulator [Selenomonadaceae bacterium]|nr:helix-turn-helix transcriptional regulator [Selenomonadaceae bacterium]
MKQSNLNLRNWLVKEIVRVRQEENMTQAELAERIGIQQSNVSRLERGHSNPSLDFIERVAKGLGRTVKIEFVNEDK